MPVYLGVRNLRMCKGWSWRKIPLNQMRFWGIFEGPPMGDDGRLEGKIKSQITRFASRLTDGWAKPLRRFVGEMLYGLQAAEDVKVSNIARSLNEKVRLIKTENRLCRNLARADLPAAPSPKIPLPPPSPDSRLSRKASLGGLS